MNPTSLTSLHRTPIATRIDEVQQRIRRAPGDADLRAQLFQLLAVRGDWDRAVEQLRLSAKLNQQAVPTAMAYEQAIEAERQREAVFAGTAEPTIFSDSPGWLEGLLLALRSTAEPAEKIAQLRAAALDLAPEVAGVLTHAPDETEAAFAWVTDGDSRLGPVCEVFFNGRYGWVPFSALSTVRFIAPQGLCDLVWAQAELTLLDGRTQQCLVPARYPAGPGRAHATDDDEIVLGRLTEWLPLHGDTYAGIGQKMWLTDAGEYGVLDVREIRFDTVAATPAGIAADVADVPGQAG